MSDGSLPQPTQARLSATLGGAPPLSAAGSTPSLAAGWAAAALGASLSSAFSAISASRTSLVAAPRSGCCSRSLASSGLRPRSGLATRSPRGHREGLGHSPCHRRERVVTHVTKQKYNYLRCGSVRPASGIFLPLSCVTYLVDEVGLAQVVPHYLFFVRRPLTHVKKRRHQTGSRTGRMVVGYPTIHFFAGLGPERHLQC
eukprot:scaffold5003_cov93-Phaeocystis_antarctica.AAC.2